MRTTWRVNKITMTDGRTMAELERVEWFKRNPAHTAMMEEYDALVEAVGRETADEQLDNGPSSEWLGEFADADPGEPTAEFIPCHGETLTIDIHDGLTLVPGDNVAVNLDALERIPA